MDAAYTKLFNKKTSREICESLKEVYFVVGAVKNVRDDKSVVCLINGTIEVVPQEKTYYLEPDWVWLQECYEALVYGKKLPPKRRDDKDDEEVNRKTGDGPAGKIEGKTGDDSEEKKLKDEEKERRRNKVKRRRKAALIAAIGVLAVSLVILVICLISLFSSDTDKKPPTPTPKVTDNPSTATGSAVTVDDMIENLNNEEYINSLPDSQKEKLDEACRIYQNMREEEAVKENREGVK